MTEVMSDSPYLSRDRPSVRRRTGKGFTGRTRSQYKRHAGCEARWYLRDQRECHVQACSLSGRHWRLQDHSFSPSVVRKTSVQFETHK